MIGMIGSLWNFNSGWDNALVYHWYLRQKEKGVVRYKEEKMWRLIIGAGMVCLLLAGGLHAGGMPEGWRYASALATAAINLTEPDVAARGDSVFTAWIDEGYTPSRIYFKRSLNKGFAWSGNSYIGDSVVKYMSVAVAPNSQWAYVLWSTRHGTAPNYTYKIKLRRSSNRGYTWISGTNEPRIIETALISDPAQSIRVDGNGRIHIGYDRAVTGRDSLYYAYSDNQGANWTRQRVCSLYVQPGNSMNRTAITTINHGGVNRVQIAYVYGGPGRAVGHAHNTNGGWTRYWPGISSRHQLPLDLESDTSGKLHLFVTDGDSLVHWKGIYNAGSNSWSWPLKTKLVHGSTSDPQAVVFGNKLYAVCNSGGPLYISESADTGNTWQEWDGLKYRALWWFNQQALDNRYAVIAAGAYERHVVFQSGSNDIWYMANDDLQLSDTTAALAFNWGRHLLRDPFGGRLDLVYFSQQQPRYTYSEDNGTTWAPHLIFDELGASAFKDTGYTPTVGQVPSMFLMTNPCAVYVNDGNLVQYRYRQDGGAWRGCQVRGSSQGVNGPPSVATTVFNGMVYVLIPVTSDPTDVPTWSSIKLCYFYYSCDPYPPTIYEEEIDWASGLNTIAEPCITYDADYNLHCVWKNNNEIVYRTRSPSGTWNPPLSQPATLVSAASPVPDFTPFVEIYGTWLAAVWCSERTSGQRNSREIYRRRKNLGTGQWDLTSANYSDSPGLPSEYPVNAGVDFSVWPESAVAGNRFDIRYKSDTYGTGWVAALQPHEYYCHSQIQRDGTPWILYTVFTRGNAAPYYLVADTNCFGGSFGGSAFYTVETGDSIASPFCLQRDAAIRYSGYRVDHGTSEISYNLHFLDPVYPAHILKGTLYFEGTGQRTHQILVNNTEKLSAKVNAGQAYPFEISIPRELYQADHRITLTLRSPTGTGVYLAGLEVIRTVEGKAVGGGSGVQSAETKDLNQKTYLRVQPNPARTKAVISYSMPGARRLSLKVFDATGRLVRQFKRLPDRQWSIVWDGRDQDGVTVSKGIYFIELVSGKDVRTEKLVITR